MKTTELLHTHCFFDEKKKTQVKIALFHTLAIDHSDQSHTIKGSTLTTQVPLHLWTHLLFNQKLVVNTFKNGKRGKLILIQVIFCLSKAGWCLCNSMIFYLTGYITDYVEFDWYFIFRFFFFFDKDKTGLSIYLCPDTADTPVTLLLLCYS